MRDHATYTIPTHIYYAYTPTAAAQLANTPPTTTPDQLANIPDVRQIT